MKINPMAIPTHQIHNVLKIFSKRLFEEERRQESPSANALPAIQRVSIAEDGKRRAIRDPVERFGHGVLHLVRVSSDNH